MKIKSSPLLNIILATVLVTSLFFMGIGMNTSGDEIAAGAGEYDPWLDCNDDGEINIRDLFAMAKAFGASGDPTKNVNVTDWEPAWKTECYWRNLNITWEQGTGYKSCSTGRSGWGFSRMFVYLKAHNRSETSLGHSITIWVSRIQWWWQHDADTFINGLEDFSPNVANMTIPGWGTLGFGGPLEFEMKGPVFDFSFEVEATCSSGWVEFDVYVYLRNE